MISVLWVGLCIAAVFFLTSTLILIHNYRFFESLEPDASDKQDKEFQSESLDDYPLVSVLIPSRNEEENLPRLLESIDKQGYPNIEIIILDDGSEDQTKQIGDQFARNARVETRVINGDQRPDNWLGKNWACHQLANAAKGGIFLFLDADTRLRHDTISQIIKKMTIDHLDFATVWPHQCMPTSKEKMVIATVYSTIALYLPTYYSFKAPRWIPPFLRNKAKPLFASACGQCMVFRRDVYFEIGGHEAVKNQVVEDVVLSRKIVSQGKTMRMFHGTHMLWCRMYDNTKDLFNGFRKNFFAGFGYHLLPFLLSWLLHSVVYLYPPVLFILLITGMVNDASIGGPIVEASFILTITPVLQRAWVNKLFQWPGSTVGFYLAGILWFHMLAIVVIFDALFKREVRWKGRDITG